MVSFSSKFAVRFYSSFGEGGVKEGQGDERLFFQVFKFSFPIAHDTAELLYQTIEREKESERGMGSNGKR